MSDSKETHEERDKINDQFFKIILEPKDAKLGIPPVFAQKLSAVHDLNQGVLHNRRTNETWKVNIERKKNKMSFTKGWLEFVAHYRLMEGDFVTFEHIGEMQFNVRIFGNTACEKTLQPPLKEEIPLSPYPTSSNSHPLAKRRRGKHRYINSQPYFSKRRTEPYFKSFPRVVIATKQVFITISIEFITYPDEFPF
ncbi:hypothetical protein Sjap_021775 [Stephania japonica]|uniref:TF-B3 domain-containing protein n=1 Tax=Stephania japonica TaxID=461633 RepID=A0AAP0EUT4_9MAGN